MRSIFDGKEYAFDCGIRILRFGPHCTKVSKPSIIPGELILERRASRAFTQVRFQRGLISPAQFSRPV